MRSSIKNTVTHLAQDVIWSARKRPLAPWAVMLTLGSFIGVEFGPWPHIWPCTVVLGVSVVVIGALLRILREHWWGDVLLVFSFALFIVSVGVMRGSDSKAGFITQGIECEVEGEVTRITRRDSCRTSAVIRADVINGKEAAKTKGLVNFRGKGITPATADSLEIHQEFKCGTRVRISGRFISPRVDLFGDFDYLEHLKGQGLSYLIEADSVTYIGRAMSVSALSGLAHDFFLSSLDRAGVSRKSQVFLQALALADKSELPQETKQAFTDCGTGHVLAVSGLHVGILSMAVIWVMGLFAGTRASGVVTLIVIWAYAFIVGLAPSIVRASIMFSFLTLEKVIGRRMPSFHSLWAALFVILLTDPASVTSAGLWLSITAVGGILSVGPVLNPLIERQRQPLRWLYGSLTISVVAQVATLPVMLYVFNSFPTYFWINNLIVIEPIKWIFVGALLCPIVSWIPVLGGCFGWVIDKGLLGVIGYCEWASSIPLATIGCTSFGMAEMAGLSLVTAVGLYALRRRSRRWLYALGVTIIGLISVLIVGEIRRDSCIALFCSNGETGVVFSEDRHNSVSYISDTTSHGAVSAVRHIEKMMRWTERDIRALGNGIIVTLRDKRIAIINTEDVDTLPPSDVYLINCNLSPETMTDVQARYLIGPHCEIGAAWQKLSSKGVSVTALRRQDMLVIK